MKKLTSILLSAIIMLTAVVGFDLTAYAGAYDTTAKAKSYTLGTTTTGYFSSLKQKQEEQNNEEQQRSGGMKR